MYYWNLTLKNGKEYLIKDKECDVKKFMETIAIDKNWRDFQLATEVVKEFSEVNTIMIRTDDISSVEYYVLQD